MGVTSGPRVIDLFSGPGGLSLGFAMAGFDIVAAADYDANVQKTYTANWPKARFFRGDIFELTGDKILDEVGPIDVVIGGPPCQGFSMANTKTRDMKNPASRVSWEFIRLVDELEPEMFVMENVLGFLSMEGGRVYQEFLNRFQRLGFRARLMVLKADDYGVPQRRERIFFIGTRNGRFYPFPAYGRLITVGQAIGDLPRLPDGGGGAEVSEYISPPQNEYQEWARRDSKTLYNHRATKSKPEVVRRFKHVPEGGNWRNIPKRLMKDYADLSKVHSHIYRRLVWDGIAVTIANFRKAVILHPKQDRIISVREAARIQSFPDSYRFHGSLGAQQQQVADAVPPLMARAVGTLVARIMGMDAPKIHQRSRGSFLSPVSRSTRGEGGFREHHASKEKPSNHQGV